LLELPSLATPLTTGVGEDVGKKEPFYMLVGMQTSTTTLEKNLEAP
jgi:hypothetical protein